MSIDVRRLDPHDDKDWAAFYDAYVEATFFERPFADAGSVPTFRVNFTRAALDASTVGWMAWDGAQVLGTMAVRRPLLDNHHVAMVELWVLPHARRRGVGSLLLDTAEAELLADGRTVMLAELPHPTDVEPTTHPGMVFAARRGYSCAHSETHFVQQLPPPTDLLERLAAHASERLGDYSLVSWIDRMPDLWVQPYCALETAFVHEAPMGDLDIGEEHWTPERVRDVEGLRAARQQRTFTTIAVAPDGSLAGDTQMHLGTQMIRRGAAQGITLVLSAHRGHRLGLAMKVANLRQLLDFDHSPRLVHTWNAGVNAPMLAVNAQLGFRPVEVVDEWQRRWS